jgi:hypothetical protein
MTVATRTRQAHPVKPARPAILERVKPETDQETTLLTGLAAVASGFLLAQAIGSILYAPLALIVPGAIFTLIAMIAKPPPPPVEDDE